MTDELTPPEIIALLQARVAKLEVEKEVLQREVVSLRALLASTNAAAPVPPVVLQPGSAEVDGANAFGGATCVPPLSPAIRPVTPQHLGSSVRWTVENPNQLGVAIRDRSSKTWYVQRCMQLGLIACLVAEEVASSDLTVRGSNATRSSSSVATSRLLKAKRVVYFHLHNDEATLTTSEPLSLPAFREHNSDPHLVAQFGTSHQRVTSETCASGRVYDIAVDTQARLVFEDGADSDKTPPRDGPKSPSGESLSLSRLYRADEVEFTLHYPALMRDVHDKLGVTTSLLKEQLANCDWCEAESSGKSEALFMFFGDFVVKSLKEPEFRYLRDQFLVDYATHVGKNPETLLPQIFAVFSVTKLQRAHTTRFVLMNNVFNTTRPIRRIFDLKGSTVGRTAVKSPNASDAGPLVYKDNDVCGALLEIGGERRARILAQVFHDAEFLQEHEVVDYSLLIGLADVDYGEPDASAVPAGASVGASECPTRVVRAKVKDSGAPCVAYIGIIDVLQTYTPAKRLENFAKGLLVNRNEISVVPPDAYASRFCRMAERVIE